MKRPLQIIAALFVGSVTLAASPYDGMTDRPIKALSPDRIEKLRTGAGAGFALTAELNGYPGPRHVLDLADALQLTSDQRQKTSSLFNQMKAEAIPLGRTIIKQEAALDTLFRQGRAEKTSLFRLTAAIGTSEARLRATHLKYHLTMADLLTLDQRTAYSRLRGYDGAPSGHRHK